MFFIAHLVGPGEGCDYTIGCNQRLVELPKAESFEEAEEQILKEYGHCMTGREATIAAVTLYEVSIAAQVDIRAYLRKIADDEAAAKRNQRERAEYERLKLKFGA